MLLDGGLLDATHAAARVLLAETAKETKNATNNAGLQTVAPNKDVHPLVQLRDLHDAASDILCKPLTDEGVAQIESLLAAGRALTVNVPQGSEWEGWEKHYRLMLDAIDLKSVQGPTPVAARDGGIKLMSSAGTATDWKGLQAAARRLGAKTVFHIMAASHMPRCALTYLQLREQGLVP